MKAWPCRTRSVKGQRKGQVLKATSCGRGRALVTVAVGCVWGTVCQSQLEEVKRLAGRTARGPVRRINAIDASVHILSGPVVTARWRGVLIYDGQ